MATIEDVAKLAGLSRTTVSRVINDQPYVTEEKKQRIIQAMKQLGYVPNSSARRLRSQKTETIAVLLPRVTNPFYGNLIEAMEERASELGYQVIVCQTHDSKQKELDYLQLLHTKQVDGVVMTSVINEWEEIEPFLQSGPIVLCNEYRAESQVSMVHMDHRLAAYESTMHLIEQGCRRIAYVSGGRESHVSFERKLGFTEALQEKAITFHTEMVIDWAENVQDGQRAFYDLTENFPEVDGIFTGSDEVAAGIIYEAGQSAWKIPGDIAVTGFDNQMLSLLMVPSITTISQPVREMAEKTIEVLYSQIVHKKVYQPSRYVYDHHLLVRNSSKRKTLSFQ
ncbi:LacI family transcriptional regulator [Halobacillus salinarum]|uniref:LacI family transcriptional regulator n=1 Tax=Halobacillus salinarum TaxID=2932257 RepID=A0ABY4EGB3_9BACI|nr:LacI family DNA-binding transcriptional regulator [Halobacillus salinarum]UOQ43492.1 LacI family transcriptional regulator [Halobacillus salinarum]